MQRLALLSILAVAACAPTTTDNRQSLLAVYEAGKRAHVETDVAALLANSADEFVTVSNGQTSHLTRADVRDFFTRYFKDATYDEYTDIDPPIVRVSDDGSMGWIISRLRASRTQPDTAGVPQRREFVYAGIMVYEKQDGIWRRVANVSTFE